MGDRIIWSPSRYDIAARCLKQYFYNYKEKSPYKVRPDLVIGKLLHERIENFYFPEDYRVKKRRLKPKLEDPEDFAKRTANLWMRKVKLDEEGKLPQPIEWKDKEKEMWQWYWTTNKLALKIHERYFPREPPALVEYHFPRVSLLGQIFWGILDEADPVVEDGLSLIQGTDHKFKRYPSGESGLKYNTQFTIYSAIMSLMCGQENVEARDFQMRMKISKEDLEQSLLNPWHMFENNRIRFRHQWGNTGYIEKGEEREFKFLDAPPRQESHLVQITTNAEFLEKKIIAGEFPTNPDKHCDNCFFRNKCTEESKKTRLTYKIIKPHKSKKENPAQQKLFG